MALSVFGALTFTPGAFGGAIQVALLMIALRYAYAVIIDVARGVRSPPALSPALLSAGLEMPLKQLGVIILFAMVYGVSQRIGDAVAGLSLLAMNLLMPATAMVIAFENSWWHAVNPVHLTRMIRPMWPTYLLLCLFLALIWLLAQALFDVLAAPLTGRPKIFVYDLCVAYFLLAMGALIGSQSREHHDALGVDLRRGGATAGPERGGEG